MKKIAVTDEKIFRVYKVFDRTKSSHADMRTSHKRLSTWRGRLRK